jgi:hypothetical protein
MAKARPKPRPKTIAEQLRDAIADSGLTCYELGQRTDLPQSTVWRFVKGERDLGMERAGKLCEVLGFQLLRPGRSAVRQNERAGSDRRRQRADPDPPGGGHRGDGDDVATEPG